MKSKNAEFQLEEVLPLEGLPLLPTAPAPSAKVLHRRELERDRQRRCRDRKRQGHRQGQSVTPSDGSVTEGLFAPPCEAPPLARFDDPPEVVFVLAALGRAARAKERVNRATIVRHLNDIAREEGLHIFNGERFLDGAFESGALPSGAIETVEVSRGLLDLLLERSQL